jgi:hypothetical protein
MALGSTQLLVKMSTRNIPGDKEGRCVRLMTSSHLYVPNVMKSGSLNLLELSGATPGLLRDTFTFYLHTDFRGH